MRSISTRDNLQMAIIMEMLEDVSRAGTPLEARAAFGRNLGKLRQMDLFVSVSVRNLEPGQYKVTRFVRGDERLGRARGLGSDNPWAQWDSLRTNTGGLIGRLISRPEPQLIYDLNEPDDPVLGDAMAGLGSCMAIPLLDGGRALNWAFHFRRSPEGFSLEELADYLLTDNIVGAMTRSLVGLEQIRALNARLREQFEQIARVQQALLPAALPAIEGVQFATSYLPSEQAGGDYYDFFDLGQGRWGLLVADVSGHGAGAATVMAMLHGILHAYPDLSCGPSAVLEFANQRLCAASAESSFTTAIFGVLDSGARELTIARAGHPHPLLKHSHAVDLLDGPSSMPLGIDPGLEIKQHTVRLDPGQTLILYTDGITEAFDRHRRMFGVDGVRTAVADSSGRADDVVDSIHGALYRHTGQRTREDDQTLVVVQVGDPAGARRSTDGRATART